MILIGIVLAVAAIGFLAWALVADPDFPEDEK